MIKQTVKKYAIVNKKECVACGSCMKVCPRNALTITKGIYAEVDTDKCVGCSLCAKACPASVIRIEKTTMNEAYISKERINEK